MLRVVLGRRRAGRSLLMARLLRWRARAGDHAFVTTDDGVALATSVTGSDNDAPTLLLVHGFGGAKEDFADHVEALARRPPRRHVRPSGSRARATLPTNRPPTRSTASPPTCCAVADAARARHASGCSGTRWAAWSRAGWCSPVPTGSTRSCSWTPRPALRPGSTPISCASAPRSPWTNGHGGAARSCSTSSTRWARPRTSGSSPNGRASASTATTSGRRSRR